MSDDPQGGANASAGTSTNADAGAARRCATCGSRIDTTEWHPLATRVDDAGEFHVHAFCDAACRDAWDGA